MEINLKFSLLFLLEMFLLFHSCVGTGISAFSLIGEQAENKRGSVCAVAKKAMKNLSNGTTLFKAELENGSVANSLKIPRMSLKNFTSDFLTTCCYCAAVCFCS